MSSDELWSYLHAGAAGIACLPIFILWLVSCCVARYRSDPARVAFVWLQFVFASAFAGFILIMVADIANGQTTDYLLYIPAFPSQAWINTIHLSYDVSLRVGSVGVLLSRLADLLLLVTFVELGNGFMFALTRRRQTYQTALRWVAIPAAGVLFVIALAALGMANTVVRDVWMAMLDIVTSADEPTWSQLQDLEDASGSARGFHVLSGVYKLFYWITSICVLSYGAAVTHRYRQVDPARGCAITYLIASVVHFLRCTWFLVDAAANDFPEVPTLSAVVWFACDAFINIVLFVVTLVFLVAVGARAKKGLWTTTQSFHNGVAPVMTYRVPPTSVAYPYGAPPPQQMHYYPQQQGYQHPPAGYPQAGGFPPQGQMPTMPYNWQGAYPQQPSPPTEKGDRDGATQEMAGETIHQIGDSERREVQVQELKS